MQVKANNKKQNKLVWYRKLERAGKKEKRTNKTKS
jgi:hypothetical protein